MPKSLSTWSCLLAVTLSPTALTLPAHADQSAQSSTHSSIQSLLTFFSSAFQPPDDDAPRSTVPAGSRDEGQCSGDRLPIHPLMPEANYGLTAEERPTLWMEMPSTRAQSVLLVLQTEAGDEHARIQLPIPKTTDRDFVAFQLPNTMEALALGQNYRWTLSVLCDGYLSPYDPLFSGWIKRVNRSTEMAQTLAGASVAEKMAILQKTGYWYDMITLMMQNQDTLNNVGAL